MYIYMPLIGPELVINILNLKSMETKNLSYGKETKTFYYTTITDFLRAVSWNDSNHQSSVVILIKGILINWKIFSHFRS